MILGNLDSSNKDFYVCSSHQDELVVDSPDSIAGSTKEIDLLGAVEGFTGYEISLSEGACVDDWVPL